MRLAEKVALRYASKNRYSVEEAEYLRHDATHGFDLKYNDEFVGSIEGALHYIEVSDFDNFTCKDDLKVLWELWSDSFPASTWEDGIPVFEITESNLDEEHQNKKCGLLMYKTIANQAREDAGIPIFFMPNYCHTRSTSDKAIRVWKSLTRKNPASSGDVIFLHEHRIRG